MIDMDRINSQLSLSHEKAIASVDPGGWGGGWIISQCREDQQSTCTFTRKGYHLCSWGGGEWMPPQTFYA